ncbi:MAG: hypothetical protein KGJ62_05570 [Armatimonadetes bacterium]|nr:hypothetical protein [Armatimonadota bacterium]MDE2207556.1 hypothetical protein [Armatimonadota bacterium]
MRRIGGPRPVVMSTMSPPSPFSSPVVCSIPADLERAALAGRFPPVAQ